MKVSSDNTSGQIKESLRILEDLFKENKLIVEEARYTWTDTISKQFMRKYGNNFIEVQQKSIGEIKSILISVESIENTLRNNRS